MSHAPRRERRDPPPGLPPLPPVSLTQLPSFAQGLRRIQARLTDVDLHTRLDLPWVEPIQGGGPSAAVSAGLPLRVERVDVTWLAVDAAGDALAPGCPALFALPEPQRTTLKRLLGGDVPPTPAAPPPWWVRASVRHCWSHLVDMPPDEPMTAPVPSDDEALPHTLPRRPVALLQGAIVQLGLPAFGGLLAHAPERAAAAACARLPEPIRHAAWEARSRGTDAAPPREDLSTLASGIDDPAALLFALGARPLGAFLAARWPLVLRQCAQRLPLPVARPLLAHHATRASTADAVRTALERAIHP